MTRTIPLLLVLVGCPEPTPYSPAPTEVDTDLPVDTGLTDTGLVTTSPTDLCPPVLGLPTHVVWALDMSAESENLVRDFSNQWRFGQYYPEPGVFFSVLLVQDSVVSFTSLHEGDHPTWGPLNSYPEETSNPDILRWVNQQEWPDDEHTALVIVSAREDADPGLSLNSLQTTLSVWKAGEPVYDAARSDTCGKDLEEKVYNISRLSSPLDPNPN